MEQAAEVPRALKKSIVEIFPAATVAIVWGSSGKDFILGVSDTDMLIIGPRDDAVEEKLKRLHDAGGELDIDPIYVTQDDFEKGIFKGQGIGREYKFHEFDLYRMKMQGKVLLGDANILDLFPEVSLDDASEPIHQPHMPPKVPDFGCKPQAFRREIRRISLLEPCGFRSKSETLCSARGLVDGLLADTLPHVRNVFIPDLKEHAHGMDDADQFVAENLDKILVIARVMYSIETKEYGSKIAALEHLGNQHPELADLSERINRIYQKQPISDEPIHPRDIRSFLDIAEKTIDER
jgi:hypothetical protein